ncbi:hypothetical protein O181_109162 [Austropuccinia psidii MF-1]|uniref:Uncharacterized protein n=1 Tax=Austropuccinia psidii MF-1 TaxID=1389203 RepID=A0A9Q3JXB6_9BASI|nr:hypothetical protein [Austropuccinia psidii MF-1]
MINLEESSVSINEWFTELQNPLQELKSLLGGVWTDDSLLALFFHQFNKTPFHHIANAFNAKKLIDTSCLITAREIMQVAQGFQQQEEEKTISNVMVLNAGRGKTNNLPHQHLSPQSSQKLEASTKSRTEAIPSRYPHPIMCPAAWATKWLSPKHPCSYCFQ